MKSRQLSGGVGRHHFPFATILTYCFCFIYSYQIIHTCSSKEGALHRFFTRCHRFGRRTYAEHYPNFSIHTRFNHLFSQSFFVLPVYMPISTLFTILNIIIIKTYICLRTNKLMSIQSAFTYLSQCIGTQLIYKSPKISKRMISKYPAYARMQCPKSSQKGIQCERKCFGTIHK